MEIASLGQIVVGLDINKYSALKGRTCDQVFNLKLDLMKHRKMEHNENVESCFNAASGTCTFGVESCWFNH